VKSLTAELKAHFALSVTTIAHIIKITRRDGFVLAVTTDYDQDIVFEGVTYKSAFGVIPTAAETSAAMNVDTMDARGALMELGVTEADIAAGLWDVADVRVMRVNFTDLTMGCEKLHRFTFGEISVGRGSFQAEMRGITQKLQQAIGDVVSPSCNATLFDARCGVSETEGLWKHSSKTVTAVSSQRGFTISSLAQAADFFTAGKVLWVTGANAGLKMEIKQQSTGGVFELQEPMPYEIQVGDTVTVWSGCRLRNAEDCRDKYDNVIRFRGFPSIPGQDQMYKGV